MSDRFLTLAQLGQHAQHCTIRAQHIAVALLLGREVLDLAAVEAEIQDLADDCGALVAALRAELGARRQGELLARERGA